MKNFILPLVCGLLLLIAPAGVHAQSVGIGTVSPDASAALDISSTAKGLLVPRLTAAQRTGIATPAAALLVYQTDGPQPGFWFNAGSATVPAWTFFNPSGDNLGNHTATQPLNLQTNALTGSGATIGAIVGVGITAQGGLNIGQNTNGNIFIGNQSGQANTTGIDNQFDGFQSGINNTTGSFNFFSGLHSGYFNTTGTRNHFDGNSSGYSNTTGTNNQFTGIQSGISNTTGSFNQFSGFASGYNTTTGSFNLFNGYQAGSSNTTGYNNQFNGYQSGQANTTGSSNQFSGFQAGTSNTTGNNNWAFGVGAGPGPATGNLTNAGALGYLAVVTQSNSLVLGGTGINAVKVGIGTTAPAYTLDVAGTINASGTVRANGVVLASDRRFKQDVQTLPDALAHVRRLRGVSYTFRQADFPTRRFPAGPQLGVIAQELEQVYPELVSTDAQGYQAVNYAQLTPVLIEALKELADQNTALRLRLAAQQDQAAASAAGFEQRLRALEAGGARALAGH